MRGKIGCEFVFGRAWFPWHWVEVVACCDRDVVRVIVADGVFHAGLHQRLILQRGVKLSCLATGRTAPVARLHMDGHAGVCETLLY